MSEFIGSYGSLHLGLELGSAWPEYSLDVLTRAAPTGAALKEWLDWMLSPWIGLLEERIGTTFSLKSAKTIASLPADSIGFRVAWKERRGHVGVAGTALRRIAWNDFLTIEEPSKRLDWLATMTYVMAPAGVFSLRDIRSLAPGAMVRMAKLECVLHVGDLTQGTRIPMRRINGNKPMERTEQNDANDWQLALVDSEPGVKGAWEDMAVPVDVILDKKLLTLGEIQRLRQGSVYTLSHVASGKSVTLCCNGRIVARGELVEVDHYWAVLITECRGEQP
ncbi:FliM/FliN family flagellar motor switch protein [Dyella monticola]|uniref:FliM/FliN family flagellar motor switch protein n=1 Tax=Dyella monticola TaxID=1927958 RepID=UPI001314D6EB|nr:FliM/FliN family flagellar motor switch protein [Dyella monticola]